MERVLIAMSGGIDSTAAALLLQEQGYELVGCTFKTRYSQDSSISDAQYLAQKLGIEHHVLDYDDLFQNTIISYFRNEYLAGRTPNPCVLCNKEIKFGALLDVAAQYGCSRIATGHYARICKSENGVLYLQKAKDELKDQTYFLWRLSQEQLAKIIFPLGDYTKAQIREYLVLKDFEVLSKQGESQDICFIKNDYRDFLQFEQEGNYVNSEGKVLGKHTGFPNYTIGQRKGLGIALGSPAFVTMINAEKNEVVLGNHDDLYQNNLIATDIQIPDKQWLLQNPNLCAKIRYRTKSIAASIEILDDKRCNVHFNEPVWGITPGQSVVFYDDNLLVGGGIIQ